MGEISTGSSSEIERIKQTLMDEFKIHQRMIRSTAVEYQTLLKKTAVRLTSGLDSIYKEKFQHLDEIAAKMASGDETEDFSSQEFCSTVFATYDLNTAQLKSSIESWNISSSKGYTDSSVFSMSTPSFETDAEVKVDVASGITKQGVFWLHLQELPESNLLALADLHKQISMKLLREKEWKSFKDTETSPEVGDYVLVDTWNGWTRGKIEKLKDDNTYAVRLVDYGDLTSCGPELLLPMKSDIYPDADYQALRCCLALDGDPFEIPIEAVWAFNDLLQENLAVRNPVTCIFKQKVFGKDNEEVCQVDLMVKDKKQNSISVSEALNKKIEDKMRGRDSIACRDIRYSAKECAVSRYVERPAEDISSQKPTPVVIENAADAVNPSPTDGQQDTTSCGEGMPELILGEQLVTEKPEVVLPENPAGDGSLWAVGKNLVTESLHPASSPDQSEKKPVTSPDQSEKKPVSPSDQSEKKPVSPSDQSEKKPASSPVQSEKKPEQVVLFEDQSVLPSFGLSSALPLDLQNLLHLSAPVYSPPLLYSPPIVSSENLTAILDRPSTLKADAAPFVSRSRTKLHPPLNPIPVPVDESVPYQPENYCVAQEESVMEMNPYFGPPMSLPMHFPNYAGAKPIEYRGNLSPVMPGMIYPEQGSAYSYMPPVLNASCIPTYPVCREQGCYGPRETIASDAPISDRNAEEAKQVEHLLPAVCSTIGSQFTGEVSSQLEVDGTVWMQPTRNEQQAEDWNRMQAAMNTCNRLTLPVPNEDVVPGLYVTVPNSKTGELYRGEVLSAKDRKAVLRCIDYGKTIVAPKDSLKPLVDKVRSLPRQALQCRLLSPSSDGDQYLNPQLCKLFDSHVKGRTMTANVMSIEPGNPDIIAVQIRDNVGRDVMDEMMQSHFRQRPPCQDDSGLGVMQPSPDAFGLSASLSDTRAHSSPGPVFPLSVSQQNIACCEPVKKLMASLGMPRGPSSLADAAQASLSLSRLPYNLSVPPPRLLSPARFCQMGDASNRMVHSQNFSSPPEPQDEWTNQQTPAENQSNHHLETSSGEMPKERNDRPKRGNRQTRLRDDEQRSTPPPSVHSDGYGSCRQVADDDRGRFGKRNSGCYNCGEMGHHANSCPQPRKGQNRGGGYGRTNSRK